MYTCIEISIELLLKIALLTFGILAAYYNDRAIFHDRRRGTKQTPGLPLIGNLFTLIRRKDSIHDLFVEFFDMQNELTWTSTTIGKNRQFVSIDPINIQYVLKGNFANYIKGPDFHSSMNDLLGDGIFNTNGSNWKTQRKNASHIFTVNNFKDDFLKIFIQEINYMMEHVWDKAVENNHIVDFHDIMHKFTLDSFVLLGFGADINGLGAKNKIPFAEAFDESQRNTFQRFINPFWPTTEKLANTLMPWRKNMNSNIEIINNFVYKIINQRRNQINKGKIYKDLLSRFIDCSMVYHDKPYTDKELRDIVLNFIIAGRDTTAQALSWCFFMVLSHPNVENKLLNEIEEYINDEILCNYTSLYNAINKMKYAHAVFYETLRLYPPVPLNQKYALKDDVLPSGGHHIKKGECFTWNAYCMGRMKVIWGEDAKKFNPDRWFNADGILRNESQYKWASFHGGPRACLGQKLATLEALVTMILLLRKYKFSLVENQNIKYQVSLTLPMKYGMNVMAEKRRTISS
ncbi:unnamed protein product [Cunninghamella blakesleeana]